MRALVQRVGRAEVTVDGEIVGAIGRGLCVFVGVTHTDTDAQAARLAAKVWNLRVMPDERRDELVRSPTPAVRVLVVSQFTLYGDTSGGRRPSWIAAARPETPSRSSSGSARTADPRCDGGDRSVPHRDAGRTGERRTGDAVDRGRLKLRRP
jgi:D-tyrosyl-tRNA(Tyr) deacylase